MTAAQTALRDAAAEIIYRWDNPDRKTHTELRQMSHLVAGLRDALRAVELEEAG